MDILFGIFLLFPGVLLLAGIALLVFGIQFIFTDDNEWERLKAQWDKEDREREFVNTLSNIQKR